MKNDRRRIYYSRNIRIRNSVRSVNVIFRSYGAPSQGRAIKKSDYGFFRFLVNRGWLILLYY